MLVMPAEAEWMIKRYAVDPTSGSLQESERTLVVTGKLAKPSWPIGQFRGGSLYDLG
jgi:hypothetical protein